MVGNKPPPRLFGDENYVEIVRGDGRGIYWKEVAMPSRISCRSAGWYEGMRNILVVEHGVNGG